MRVLLASPRGFCAGVDRAGEIDPAWLRDVDVVGVTAGTVMRT